MKFDKRIAEITEKYQAKSVIEEWLGSAPKASGTFPPKPKPRIVDGPDYTEAYWGTPAKGY